MQDNELYNYFRERKSTFDEMPQETLWNRIDNQLPGAGPRPAAVKAIFSILAVILLSAGITTVFFWPFKEDPVNVPIMPPAPDFTPVPQPDAVVAEPPAPEPFDTVKKKKAQKIFSTRRTDNDTPKAGNGPGLPFAPTTPPAPAPPAPAPDVTVRQYGSTIKVTTRESLSDTGFDTLVARYTRAYSSHRGKILIVSAEGRKPYRLVIGEPKVLKPAGHTLRQEYIRFMPVPKPAIAVEHIRFKKDSVEPSEPADATTP